MDIRSITRIAILFATIPLVAFSCINKLQAEGPNCHKRITMKNCSPFPILIYEDYYNGIKAPSDGYLGKEFYDRLKKGGYLIIQPQGTETIWELDEYGCVESALKDATLDFFIFDPEIIDEFTAEELTDGRALLEVRRFTLEDLRTTGGNIVYK